jgi:ferrochelatase
MPMDRDTASAPGRDERPRECVRVVLAAHGEAESRALLENFHVSRRTLAHAAEVMSLPLPLRLAICALGALRKRLGGYAGSPHNANTRRQAAALEDALRDDAQTDYRVQALFASAAPSLDAELAMPAGVDRQVVVSMIPTDSRLSCGLICQPLHASPDTTRRPARVLARLWEAPDFIALQAEHVARCAATLPGAASRCLILLLHGTVVRDKRGCPPSFHTGVVEKTAYAQALRETLLAAPARTWDRVELAYLNHGVGGEWSSPRAEVLLERLAREGVDEVVAYPCEHLVEGTETDRLPSMLASAGIATAHLVPPLNASPGLIDYLAGRVRAVVADHEGRLCDPCPLRPGLAAAP